jgi:hypothetical protein
VICDIITSFNKNKHFIIDFFKTFDFDNFTFAYNTKSDTQKLYDNEYQFTENLKKIKNFFLKNNNSSIFNNINLYKLDSINIMFLNEIFVENTFIDLLINNDNIYIPSKINEKKDWIFCSCRLSSLPYDDNIYSKKSKCIFYIDDNKQNIKYMSIKRSMIVNEKINKINFQYTENRIKCAIKADIERGNSELYCIKF